MSLIRCVVRACFLTLLLVAAGCGLLAVKEQQARIDSYCRLRGSVSTDSTVDGQRIVVLLRHQGGNMRDRDSWRLMDHFASNGGAGWVFFVDPGTYLLTAFVDTDRDGLYERDEPAIPPDFDKAFACGTAETKDGMELVIPRDGRFPIEGPVDIAQFHARSSVDQVGVSLGRMVVAGDVVSLGDPRFSRENARKGLWRPYDFIWEAKPGLYFLEPYNPAKTPVLFVHGMNGTPTDFQYLIERLDRARFQPWVAYYPSGARLDKVATYFDHLVSQIDWQYRPGKLAVVAHSMGGLVSRALLLKHAAATGDNLVPLFISIASPWNGHNAAQLGVDHAPTPVRAWVDMAPGSGFLTRLFYSGDTPGSGRLRLPPGMAHHLIFSFLPTESGDGTVSLGSQLRGEAQEEAFRLYGISQSHVGVLNDPKTSEMVNQILRNPG